MKIIIPMNGTGERFRQAGYPIPKPFLTVRQKPLLRWVLDSLPKECGILFIPRWEYIPYLEDYVRPQDMSLPITMDTSGPLETLLHADQVAHGFLDSEDILIADCDAFFLQPLEVTTGIRAFQGSMGGTWMRHTTDPMCAYATVHNSYVLEVREKEPFTDTSLTGPYWWSSGNLFRKHGRKALMDGEVSVAPVYNQVIREGGMVTCVETSTYEHLGSPEAYEAFSRRINV